MNKRLLAGALGSMMATAGLAEEPAPPPFEVAMEAEAVVATGVTAGGSVVWFGFAKEVVSHAAQLLRHDEIAIDDDGDGEVRLELGRAVPPFSLWFAVDLATGAFAVAAPEGMPIREVGAPPRVSKGSSGALDRLVDGRRFVEGMLVRPGLGAWGVSAGDGGDSDDDGVFDGKLTLDLLVFRPVGDSPELTPVQFQENDVVLAIDAETLELYAATLSGGA